MAAYLVINPADLLFQILLCPLSEAGYTGKRGTAQVLVSTLCAAMVCIHLMCLHNSASYLRFFPKAENLSMIIAAGWKLKGGQTDDLVVRAAECM